MGASPTARPGARDQHPHINPDRDRTARARAPSAYRSCRVRALGADRVHHRPRTGRTPASRDPNQLAGPNRWSECQLRDRGPRPSGFSFRRSPAKRSSQITCCRSRASRLVVRGCGSCRSLVEARAAHQFSGWCNGATGRARQADEFVSLAPASGSDPPVPPSR